MKPKLWIRKLSCGHERPTNIAFISGIYDKPKVNDFVYCRECFEPAQIIKVYEADENTKRNLKNFVKGIKQEKKQ